MVSVPLSILDLSPIGTGQSASDALAGTTALAQRADELGYRRFWVAEHHNIPSVASTAPEVLIAHLAARTGRIRSVCAARCAISTSGAVEATDRMLWCSATQNRR